MYLHVQHFGRQGSGIHQKQCVIPCEYTCSAPSKAVGLEVNIMQYVWFLQHAVCQAIRIAKDIVDDIIPLLFHMGKENSIVDFKATRLFTEASGSNAFDLKHSKAQRFVLFLMQENCITLFIGSADIRIQGHLHSIHYHLLSSYTFACFLRQFASSAAPSSRVK